MAGKDDEVLVEAEDGGEFLADAFHEAGELVDEGGEAGGELTRFEVGSGALEDSFEGSLGEEGLEAVSDNEPGVLLVGVEADEDVAVAAVFELVGGKPGGVEEPEQVDAEGDLRSELLDDDEGLALGEALAEGGRGPVDGLFVGRSEGLGEIGEAGGGEEGDRAEQGSGPLEVQIAAGAGGRGLRQGGVAVGTGDHKRDYRQGREMPKGNFTRICRWQMGGGRD